MTIRSTAIYFDLPIEIVTFRRVCENLRLTCGFKRPDFVNPATLQRIIFLFLLFHRSALRYTLTPITSMSSIPLVAPDKNRDMRIGISYTVSANTFFPCYILTPITNMSSICSSVPFQSDMVLSSISFCSSIVLF